jgi:hypothetical protein
VDLRFPSVRATLRLVLASGLGLALWTVALPAWASSAPFCDDRGATALAATPVLVGGESGVQVAPAKATCDGEELFFGASLTRGHPAPAPTADAPEPYVAPAVPSVAPSSGDELIQPPEVASPTEGVRWRVERPPRG